MTVPLAMVALAVQGLLVGVLARLALPGRDPLTLLETALVGVCGSLAAGLVTYAAAGRPSAGAVLSLAFSVTIVYAIRRSRGGGLRDPGRAPAPRR